MQINDIERDLLRLVYKRPGIKTSEAIEPFRGLFSDSYLRQRIRCLADIGYIRREFTDHEYSLYPALRSPEKIAKILGHAVESQSNKERDS